MIYYDMIYIYIYIYIHVCSMYIYMYLSSFIEICRAIAIDIDRAEAYSTYVLDI